MLVSGDVIVKEHVCTHGLLSDHQFGFRPGASTAEAILAVTQACHQALEWGNSMACVFSDVSKVFDSLPHHLILRSLTRVGVCGVLLAWVADYLTDCLQRTVLSGSRSSVAPVSSGVPQGCPLLFILFMNSIISVNISVDAGITLYADDLCYHKEVSSESDGQVVQADVNAVLDWASDQRAKAELRQDQVALGHKKEETFAVTTTGQCRH